MFSNNTVDTFNFVFAGQACTDLTWTSFQLQSNRLDAEFTSQCSQPQSGKEGFQA